MPLDPAATVPGSLVSLEANMERRLVRSPTSRALGLPTLAWAGFFATLWATDNGPPTSKSLFASGASRRNLTRPSSSRGGLCSPHFAENQRRWAANVLMTLDPGPPGWSDFSSMHAPGEAATILRISWTKFLRPPCGPQLHLDRSRHFASHLGDRHLCTFAFEPCPRRGPRPRQSFEHMLARSWSSALAALPRCSGPFSRRTRPFEQRVEHGCLKSRGPVF
jgi:hypothetical protein